MRDDYREYLEEKHSAFQTPESVVSGMVRRATGEELVSSAKIVRGNDNEVHQIATGGGLEYIVRIHRGGEVDLHAEAVCIQEYRAAGAPVPAVHLVDLAEHGGEQIEFMVMDRAPGRPLSELAPDLGPEDWRQAGNAAGAALGRMHAVRAGGFYHRDANGNWDFPDWPSVMASTIEGRSADAAWIRQVGFSDAELAFMARMVEVYRDEFDCPEPVLCHGDFLPEHIFVDEDLNVTAVIDFGMCQGAHPIHDFAVLAMTDTGLTPGLVLEGYPRREWVADRFQLRLYLHKLTLDMGFLAHHVRIGHYAEIPENARSLRETLEYLRRERA